MNELEVQHTSQIQTVTWTPEQIDLIKHTIAAGATHDELQLFLYQAKRTGLDPLSRQIHFVKRKDKGTIQTAIDGYRLIADRTGKYAGNDDYLFDEGLPQYAHMQTGRGNPTTATATVYKMCDGLKTAFTATAGWTEYFPGEPQGFMWKKMPYLMIGKCAESLALRKAFPAELSGIYTNEEMGQAEAGAPPVKPTAPSSTEPLAPNYGPYAKQPLTSIPEDELHDYRNGLYRAVNDPKKEKFKAMNAKMISAIEAELLKREKGLDAAKTLHEASQSAPSDPIVPVANICQQLRLCESEVEVNNLLRDLDHRFFTKEDYEEFNTVLHATKARLGIT